LQHDVYNYYIYKQHWPAQMQEIRSLSLFLPHMSTESPKTFEKSTVDTQLKCPLKRRLCIYPNYLQQSAQNDK